MLKILKKLVYTFKNIYVVFFFKKHYLNTNFIPRKRERKKSISTNYAYKTVK